MDETCRHSRKQFSIRAILLMILLIAIAIPLMMRAWDVYRQVTVPWRRVSPFTAVAVGANKTMVRYDGQPYELLSIDGATVDELLQASANAFGQKDAERRFVEDVAEVLEAAGKNRWADTVKLVLVDPASGQQVTIKHAPMTVANRRDVMNAQATIARQLRRNPGSGSPLPEPTMLVAGRWRRVSPFTAVERRDDRLMVEYEGQEYELKAIEGVPLDELVRAAEVAFGKDKADKRVIEDIAEVLGAAGKNGMADAVELVLRDPASGEVVTIDEAPMTAENRRMIMRRRLGRQRPRSPALVSGKQEFLAAIDQFETALRERWSYLPVADLRLAERVQELRQLVETEKVKAETIRYELNKIIACGIDGHAEVAGGAPSGSGRFLPVLIEPIGVDPGQRRFVAFLPDRSEFVSKAHPYLVKIDGRPLDFWIEIAKVCNPQGSPQYVQRHALRELRQLPHWRRVVGDLRFEDVVVTLTNADGSESIETRLPLTDEKPFYGSFPTRSRASLAKSTLREQKIGYLRLNSMDDQAVQAVHETMAEVRAENHRGLVVDVRGNGGGSRDALRTLFSYLTDNDETPRVCNAAVYRKFAEFDKDHLAARFMYRRSDPIWSADERAAIESFAAGFRPEWQPPEEGYSDWHYMVLSRLDDRDYFRFRGPVIVLMDAKCFSATDIFLAGLKGWPNVTLIGQASGGGSARAKSVDIADGRISVRLGSMVSFQLDGRLFDGHGVEPDVIVLPTPGSFLANGQDNLIDRAAELIAEQTNSSQN